MDSPGYLSRRAEKGRFRREATAHPAVPPPGIRLREKTRVPHRRPARACRKTIDIPFVACLKYPYFRIIFGIQDRWERGREIPPPTLPRHARPGEHIFGNPRTRQIAAPAGGTSWIRAHGCAHCSSRLSSSFLCRRWPASWGLRATRRAMTGMRAASSSRRKSSWRSTSTPGRRLNTGREKGAEVTLARGDLVFSGEALLARDHLLRTAKQAAELGAWCGLGGALICLVLVRRQEDERSERRTPREPRRTKPKSCTGLVWFSGYSMTCPPPWA